MQLVGTWWNPWGLVDWKSLHLLLLLHRRLARAIDKR